MSRYLKYEEKRNVVDFKTHGFSTHPSTVEELSKFAIANCLLECKLVGSFLLTFYMVITYNIIECRTE